MSTVSRPSSAVPIPITAPAQTKRQRRGKSRREEVLMGYLFILVPFIIFLTFSFAGMIYDFWISFHRWDVISTPTFVGSANYNYIFRVDPVFWTAIKNTIEYAVIVVTCQTILSFVLALIVNQNIRG
jgi:ABC-type sugar transport system permease subunit